MANTFPCKIVPPTAEAYSGEATYVSFPSWDGQYGMMKGLAPLLSTLAPGSLRIDSEDGESYVFLIEGGFAHVNLDGLTLVTEGAIPVDELNLEDAQAELAEANARVTTDDMDRAAVERAQKIGTAKVALASKS